MRIMFLLLVLLPQLVFGATITGVVYDLDLEPVQDTVVTIDTSPEQRAVAKEGSYLFNVPEGSYHLAAVATIEGEEWLAEEDLTVTGEGEYTLDLILFPTFSEVDDLEIDDVEVPALDENGSSSFWIWLIVISVVAIVGIGYFYTKLIGVKAPKNIVEEDEFRTAVLKAIKKHKGRITQKELRKELPFSEAKVSLILTELEDEGVIKKIKKGRGNVIVMQ